MDHQSSGNTSYTSPSLATSGADQKQQRPQGIPQYHSYYDPFHDQVPSPYYHVGNQSHHMVPPLSPRQQHFHPSQWNVVPPLLHLSTQSHPYYPNLLYPSPPPSFPNYYDPFCSPTPQSFSNLDSNYAGDPTTFQFGTATNANSATTLSSTSPGPLRGPPRKPRQSGHALWVGNLPFGTNIVKLKEHFSTAAMATIESVFWITKSKSAFVNYKTAEALVDAMLRFHDSKFEGVRLVCRARRAGTPNPIATATVTATALRSGHDTRSDLASDVKDSIEAAKSDAKSSESGRASEVNTKAPLEKNAKKRFFIMKSLAKEDLQSSVQNGHWVTQKHNERTLNEAFVCADEVYLIFSANKSGEYFGYARMQGLTKEQRSPPRPAIPGKDASKPCRKSDMPEIVFTPGTESAPKGAIFIDAYRGTIFWEADLASQDEPGPEPPSEAHNARNVTESAEEAKDKEWNLSSPFEIKWMSTARLPFHRTRGLRNPWNANREVKIARDGTELETNVGIRMLELFHQTKLPIFWDSSGFPFVGPQVQSPV